MVTVIGAGVSGLTTAVVLRRSGVDAHIVAAQPASEVVSWLAAAIWTFPDLAGREPLRGWALRSRREFEGIAQEPEAGVAPLFHRELFRSDPGEVWWESTPWVHRLTDPPAGFQVSLGIEGFRIEPPIYLPWLQRQFGALGGTITLQRLETLGDVSGTVVNCSGLGAATLADDASLYPIRGQVVAVGAPSVDEGVADESDPDRIAYVYPRSTEVIVGGTRDVGATSIDPDPSETERMLHDAARLDPRLAGADIRAVRVGLRPGRDEVRVETEIRAGRTVIHNYGHGGYGFLLSWGCADNVLALLRRDGLA